MLSQESSGAMSFPGAETNSSHAVSGLEVSVVMFEGILTSEHPNKKIEHNMDTVNNTLLIVILLDLVSAYVKGMFLSPPTCPSLPYM